MKNQRQAETEEQAALAREKHRLAMKNQCQAETEEQAALAREKQRLEMKKQRQAETEEQAALAREKHRLSQHFKRHAKTHEQAALARERDKLRKLQSRSDDQDGDMENVINQSMKESVKYLHRTKDPENPLKHRAIVCIICDRFIIGTEAIHKLTKELILLHERRLSVASFEEYYETKLKSDVTKQYEVNDLKGMLLSP